MGKEVNKKELSEILGFDERSLTEWQHEDPPLPIKQRGERRGQANKYDTADAIAWYVQREMRTSQVEMPRDRLARLQSVRSNSVWPRSAASSYPPTRWSQCGPRWSHLRAPICGQKLRAWRSCCST